MSFDLAGKVTFIAQGPTGQPLQPGDRVRAGQLLAAVDDRQLQSDRDQAQARVTEAQQEQVARQAQVAVAQAQVAQAQAQVAEAEAQVNRSRSALNLAETELRRYEGLAQQGIVSPSDLDVRRNQVQDALAGLRATEARVSAAQGEVSAARAQQLATEGQLKAAGARITTAEAGVAQATLAMEKAKLYAPFDGLVGHLNLRLGEYYVPQGGTAQLDQADGAGSVPIVLYDPMELVVEVALPADGQLQAELGQVAFVLTQASEPELGSGSGSEPGSGLGLEQANPVQSQMQSPIQGRVMAIAPAIDPSLRSRQVTIAIERGGELLQHGDWVTAMVVTATAEAAVTVPLEAVVYRDRQPYVFVADALEKDVSATGASMPVLPGSASVGKGDRRPNRGLALTQQRPVQLGISGLTEQQILSGVGVGEAVVVEGQSRLAGNMPVQLLDGLGTNWSAELPGKSDLN
ncbi:MAG: hypothetical protein HC824_08765 [Synechococcales cyanobacterium RM1_1_8]|nr:hypothetical protein [Synechococcales cyanobacterium RM1_1_8]